jgi:hypothetical protein
VTTIRDAVATTLLFLFAVAAPVSNGLGNIATGAFLGAALLVVLLTRRLDGLPPRGLVRAGDRAGCADARALGQVP